MSATIIELLVILLLIMVNGAFATAEIAIVSSRKSRLEQWAKEGNDGARAALALANKPNVFLATIQIGITVTAILTGVFGGATIAETLEHVLRKIPLVQPYAAELSLGAVVTTISYLTLILGELAPKQVALANAEKMACLVGPPLTAISKIAYPIVRLLNASSDFVVRLLGVKQSDEPPVTTEEIKLMISHGTQAGVFQEAEEDMVKGVLRLGARKVTALMTPRPKLICLGMSETHQEILQKLVASPPTRLLVIEDDLDHVIGYVYTRHILAQPVFAKTVDLKACLKQPLYVPENKTALQVLDMFKHSGTHIAIVVDEYGSVQGVVTMTDMLKAIIGDTERPEAPMAETVGGKHSYWVLDGFLPIDRLKETIAVESLPQESQYQTLAGFIMHQVGDVPELSDEIEWGGFSFHVLSMNGRRIDKVAVRPIEMSNVAQQEKAPQRSAKQKSDHKPVGKK
jgi:putative hemolysin